MFVIQQPPVMWFAYIYIYIYLHFHILSPAVFLQYIHIGATWYIPKSIFVSDFLIASIYQCIENSEGRSIHVHTGHTNTKGIRMWNAWFWRCVLISNKDLWHATDMCQHVQHKIRADIEWLNTFHVFQRNHKFLLSAMFVIGIFFWRTWISMVVFFWISKLHNYILLKNQMVFIRFGLLPFHEMNWNKWKIF